MKHYLTLIFAFVTTLSFAAYPVGSRENIDGSVLGWDETNKCWRPIAVDATGQMKGTSTGDVVIASISVDTSKIEGYLKETSSIHKNIDSTATNTENILKIFNGESIDNNIVNDIKTAVGEGTTATDTVIGRLKNIEEKLGESSSEASLDIGNTATDTEKIRMILDGSATGDNLVQGINNLLKNSTDTETKSITKLLSEISGNTSRAGSVDVDLSGIKSESDTSSDTVVSLLRKANEGVVMDTVRYSNGSHGTGDTASVLFDGTLRAVPNFKIDAGSNTSPIKDKTERVFVEFKVPLTTQTFFVGFKNDEKHLRPVTGRALFEVGTQDLYIKIPSDSGIDYLWITEGWR